MGTRASSLARLHGCGQLVFSPAAGSGAAELRRAYDAAQARIAELLDRLGRPPRLAPLPLEAGEPLPATSPYAREAFEHGVERIREYIRAGDTFQTVLSRRHDVAIPAEPLGVYRALRT
ncbi:MAG TPA: hypothetical protein DHU96_25535, partial [Actinobacteria bacterium]|nr:hypothetical protein [Actinomycetota bacterium]